MVVNTCGLSVLSAHLISCLSRVNCSYLFISYYRQTPKGDYPGRQDIYNLMSLRVFPNKTQSSESPLISFASDLETPALVGIYLLSKTLVISFEFFANKRAYEGFKNVVFFPFHKTRNYKTLGVCVFGGLRGLLVGGPCFFKPHLQHCFWGMLLSSVVFQSKPSMLRGKYVQCPEAQVLLLNSS